MTEKGFSMTVYRGGEVGGNIDYFFITDKERKTLNFCSKVLAEFKARGKGFLFPYCKTEVETIQYILKPATLEENNGRYSIHGNGFGCFNLSEEDMVICRL